MIVWYYRLDKVYPPQGVHAIFCSRRAARDLICPACEADTLAPITFRDFFQHGGREISVADLEGYECPHCGAEPIFEDQIRRNHARIADAKRKADGLLTGSQIKALVVAICCVVGLVIVL